MCRNVASLLLQAFLLCSPAISVAEDVDIEADLQRTFENSRASLVRAINKLQTGESFTNEITQIKASADVISAKSMLIQERFSQQETEISGHGLTAYERHRAMAEGYRKALEEYLSMIASLPSDQDVTLEQLRSLLSFLDRIIQKKPRPVIGSLPYRNLNYPSKVPSQDQTITPAYKGGTKEVGNDDLRDTPEAPISMEFAKLAQSLNWNPVSIYEYVKNNIDTEWYFGCMKGATETLHQKSGNDCDQAALLVALLRASGFPSRYVRGVIGFMPGTEHLKKLTGIDTPWKIAELLQKAGIPFKPVIAAGSIASFQIEHVWVETQVPYANYRGAIIDENGKTWLGLDTSIKVKGYQYSSAIDILNELPLSNVRDQYISAVQAQTPLEFIKTQIGTYLSQKYTDKTYNDLLATKTLIPEVLNILPASMQFTDDNITNEYTAIPDDLKHKIRFTANDLNNNQLFTITFDALALSNKSVALRYEPEAVEDQEIIDSYGGLDNTPPYLVRLRPALYVDSDMVIAGKDGVPMGSDWNLTVELISPNGTEKINSTHIAGNVAVIGIVSQRVVQPAPMAADDKDAERLQFEETLNYIERWNKSEDEMASLFHLAVSRPIPTVATVGGVIDVSYLLDKPRQYKWKGVFVDANLKAVESVPLHAPDSANGRQKTFIQLSGLQGSVLESKLFEDDFKVDSVSTAKMFGLASSSQPATQILSIDKTNIDSILPTISLDENIQNDIINAVNEGYTVSIPQAEIIYEDWTGIGYIKENATTGESGYMLSGMIAGGMTAWSVDKWSDYYRRLGAQDAEPANPDPTQAYNIAKVTPTDLQIAEVNRRLDKSLAVKVTDKKGKAVWWAEVVFTIKAGGGKLLNYQSELDTVTVRTDLDGIAQVPLKLGKETKANPTFMKLDSEDDYATQVGENIIDVYLKDSGTATKKSFTAYGKPGTPVALTQTFGDGQRNYILNFSGYVSVIMTDQYENPVANQPVIFTAKDAIDQSNCQNKNTDTRQAMLVKAGEKCIDNSPVLGECGSSEQNSIEIKTDSSGSAAVQVILGAIPAAQYPIEARYGQQFSTTFNHYTRGFGNCSGDDPPATQFVMQYIYPADQYGNNINAGKVDTDIPVMARLFFIKEKEKTIDASLSCEDGSKSCPRGVGAREYEIVTDLKRANVSFADKPPTSANKGIYTGEYKLQLGKNEVEIKATDVAIDVTTTEASCVFCGPQTKEIKDDGGSLTMEVYGVKIDINNNPTYRALINTDGYAIGDSKLDYTINPSEYKALTAGVALYKGDAEDPFVYIPSETQEHGYASVATGFQFDAKSEYKVAVILNSGTGVEIKSDKRTIEVGEVTATKWLVTHDPAIEKQAQQYPDTFKHAAVMKNKAKVTITGVTGTCQLKLIKRADSSEIFTKEADITADKYAEFKLRTCNPNDDTCSYGAMTDQDGNIYVEGRGALNAPPIDPGYYDIALLVDDVELGRVQMAIQPLMTNLVLTPDITDPSKKLDPYSDEIHLADAIIDANGTMLWPAEKGYGLEIHYRLNSDATKFRVYFEDDESANDENKGDMSGTHDLLMNGTDGKSDTLLQRSDPNDPDYRIKWEGFDATITDELADKIYMFGGEAKKREVWYTGDTTQYFRGIAPRQVVKEGKYKNTIELKLKNDEEQMQKYELRFVVEYRLE